MSRCRLSQKQPAVSRSRSRIWSLCYLAQPLWELIISMSTFHSTKIRLTTSSEGEKSILKIGKHLHAKDRNDNTKHEIVKRKNGRSRTITSALPETWQTEKNWYFYVYFLDFWRDFLVSQNDNVELRPGSRVAMLHTFYISFRVIHQQPHRDCVCPLST